ncbi:hypothetical protein Asppvi_000108 [Aspergillus pseudoviridinutans]|uniref:Uncharacterized protein n=1 Tax=Aspergillus pseudoviridinutans TaxID=1517512 RepID=A0A9P3EP12_9EURO|nr:uncharacterized protein Asppvi_000108 [Aspergillus pseudoviridinutans]GIJ81609.1 hypothetical protein Asppvi_000108 [Aspergillus pseudoviridinutans]
MSSPAAAAALASTVTSAAALGFVPVAVRFQLFDILADLDKPVSGQDVLTALQDRSNGKTRQDVPCMHLVSSRSTASL